MQHIQIRVKGQIDERWSEWLDGLTIVHTWENETLLTGPILDQSALYGLIAKLRDLGLPLSAVNVVEEVSNEREGGGIIMSNQVNIQQAAVLSREEMVDRLAHHLEQQSEPLWASDRLMKRLEVASLLLPLAALVAAIVAIATSSASLSKSIPAALFAIWGCFALCMFLIGLHSVVIRAFPPLRYLMAAQTKKSPGFFTGGVAVGIGVLIMVAALVFVSWCAMAAYAFFNPDILKILIPYLIIFLVACGLLGSLGIWLQKRAS